MTTHQAFVEAYMKWQASVPGSRWAIPSKESEALWLAYVSAREEWLYEGRAAMQMLPPATA